MHVNIKHHKGPLTSSTHEHFNFLFTSRDRARVNVTGLTESNNFSPYLIFILRNLLRMYKLLI